MFKGVVGGTSFYPFPVYVRNCGLKGGFAMWKRGTPTDRGRIAIKDLESTTQPLAPLCCIFGLGVFTGSLIVIWILLA